MNKIYTYTFPTPSRPKRKGYLKTLPLVLLLGAGAAYILQSSLLTSYFSKEISENRFFSQDTDETVLLKEKLKRLSPKEQEDIDLIARTVYGEARGEQSSRALQAIAHVILNRMRDKNNWPSSIKEVILQKEQFSCWNEKDPNFYKIQSVSFNNKDFIKCYEATLDAFFSKTDLIHGANHYHSRNVFPRWARKKNMIKVAQIKKHIFYRS